MERDISLGLPHDTSNQKCIKKCSKLCMFLKNKENIFMILILVVKLLVFSLLFIKYYNKTIVICDSINMAITCIGFILIMFNKAYSLMVHWFLYVADYICILTIHFLTSKESKGIAYDHKDVYLNFIFLNIYIQNCLFFIGYMHYQFSQKGKSVHLILWIMFDISLLCVINITFAFSYETITFIFCFILAFCSYFNIEDIFKPVSNINKPTCDCDSIIHPRYETIPSFYGSCVVNENFMIKYQNSFFSEHMQDLCVMKVNQYSNREENDDNRSMKTNSKFYSSVLLVSLPNNQPTSRNCNSKIWRYLNGDNMLLRNDDESQHDKTTLFDVFYIQFVYLIKSSNGKSKNQPDRDNFVALGKFKYIHLPNEGRYYEVYCRVIPNNNNEDLKKESLFEIAFYELTDNLKKNKNKIEKKYKNLLLRKINHEFKVPIVLIQNMINEIIESSTSDHVISISNTIKYVTDAILLLVSDLTEYIHLNTMKVEDQEMKSSSGFVSLFSLYQDIQNICLVYMKLYDKNVGIQFDINERLKYGKIMINETKLKQILSILITNAIKNSTQIIITFDLKEKFVRAMPFTKCLTSSLKPIENSPFKMISVNTNHLSPKAKRVNKRIEYDISISVEDNGPGIEKKIMNSINASSKFGRILTNEIMPIIACNSYKNEKGLGTGLLIALKLCKDLNISLKCDSNVHEAIVHGAKFTLNIDYDITFEENTNDAFIYEFSCENSNSTITNQSVLTKQIYIEDFHIGINDNKYGHFDKNNLSDLIVPPKSPRKSRSTLFFKSKFFGCIEESAMFIPVQLEGFTINSLISRKKTKKSLTKLSDTPLINCSDKDFQSHEDKYKSNPTNGKSILISPKLTNLQYIKSDLKLQKKSTFVEVISPKYKINQGLSLFHGNSKSLKVKKEIKDIDGKDDTFSNDPISVEDKQIIVIVDDIDSNKKAIFSLINKHLIKREKLHLYNFELLSDGIELLNKFYNDKASNMEQIKIIFCDECMNFLNGSEAFSVMNKISISKNLKNIPFILCSAFSDNGFKEKMLSIGIKNVYEKPLQSSIIEKIIDEFKL